MAIIALDTTFKSQMNRAGASAYFVLEGKAVAATATTVVAAPFNGKLTSVLFCNGETVMSGSHKYVVTVLNAANSDAAMISSYDAGTAAVGAYATGTPTLSATAANLVVSRGDSIEVVMTVTGTVTGGNVLLYFEGTE
jgi:hypothetical protein